MWHDEDDDTYRRSYKYYTAATDREQASGERARNADASADYRVCEHHASSPACIMLPACLLSEALIVGLDKAFALRIDSICLSICLSIYQLSIYLCIDLSTNQSMCINLYVCSHSVCVYVCTRWNYLHAWIERWIERWDNSRCVPQSVCLLSLYMCGLKGGTTVDPSHTHTKHDDGNNNHMDL